MDVTKFETTTYFSCLKLNKFNNEVNDKQFYLAGKMFEHSIDLKYQFKACEFLVYFPTLNPPNLFLSEMNSQECFNNLLKWNDNFFKKINRCLSGHEVKNSYFCLNYIKDTHYEPTQEEKDLFTQTETLTEADNKLCLTLEFSVDNKEILALKLNLLPMPEENPLLKMTSKLLEYEKFEDEIIENSIKIINEKTTETEEIEETIKKNEEDFSLKKKNYLYKFGLLNREKNKLIKKMESEMDLLNSGEYKK